MSLPLTKLPPEHHQKGRKETGTKRKTVTLSQHKCWALAVCNSAEVQRFILKQFWNKQKLLQVMCNAQGMWAFCGPAGSHSCQTLASHGHQKMTLIQEGALEMLALQQQALLVFKDNSERESRAFTGEQKDCCSYWHSCYVTHSTLDNWFTHFLLTSTFTPQSRKLGTFRQTRKDRGGSHSYSETGLTATSPIVTPSFKYCTRKSERWVTS